MLMLRGIEGNVVEVVRWVFEELKDWTTIGKVGKVGKMRKKKTKSKLMKSRRLMRMRMRRRKDWKRNLGLLYTYDDRCRTDLKTPVLCHSLHCSWCWLFWYGRLVLKIVLKLFQKLSSALQGWDTYSTQALTLLWSLKKRVSRRAWEVMDPWKISLGSDYNSKELVNGAVYFKSVMR